MIPSFAIQTTLTSNLKVMKRILSLVMLVLTFSTTLMAQNRKVTDKDLQGVWFMEWMQWEGEKKIVCGKTSGYGSFKYYGPTGEYACAELALSKNGEVTVLPHEYGTYSFKNGAYIEMGRKQDLTLLDKTHFKCIWTRRHEQWRKCTTLPEKTVRYIIESCKIHQGPSADIQKTIIQNVFNK